MEFLHVVSFQGNPPHLSILFRVAFQSPEMINFVVPVLETSFSPKILINCSCSR